MNKKLKIGIVGCGTIADIHALAINESSNALLVSAFSRNKKNAKQFGEKYQITWFTDWDLFISDNELDAVSICTPNGTHLDYGKKAAEANKHIILEKPIEVTLARARALITVCKKNKVQLAVIYQSRFQDGMYELKRQIDQGKIGKLIMGDAYIKWYRSQEYYDSGAWRGTFKLDGGGVLINQAIHTIDLLQWLVGPVNTIFGQTGTFDHKRLEGEDNASAVLRFKNGAIGVIQASTSVQPSQSRRIEIHGEKGSIIINGDEIVVFTTDDSDSLNEKKEIPSSGSSSPLGGFSIEPHKKQIEAITDAIHNKRTPVVSGEDSLRSLEIVLALYESAKTNTKVIMDDFVSKQCLE